MEGLIFGILRYFPLELYSEAGAGPQKVYQTSMGQGYKCKGNNNEGEFTKLKTSKRYNRTKFKERCHDGSHI